MTQLKYLYDQHGCRHTEAASLPISASIRYKSFLLNFQLKQINYSSYTSRRCFDILKSSKSILQIYPPNILYNIRPVRQEFSVVRPQITTTGSMFSKSIQSV